MHAHVMDVHPERFGWRLWHIENGPFRLSSPMHKGKVRTGARFVESVCSHRDGQFTLAEDCACGVYYEGRAPMVERWHREVEYVATGEVALTFGVAVGDVDIDPLLPDVAWRAPRYAILAILLPCAHPAAGDLRSRYKVNVVQKSIGLPALEHVEDAVRGDLRRTDSTQFFADLRAEPLTADSGHILDRNSEAFGWHIWRLDSATGTLFAAEDTGHRIRERRHSSGPVYFESVCAQGHSAPVPECRCGLSYVGSSFYCEWRHIAIRDAYLAGGWGRDQVQFAATYGWYEGGTVDAPDLGADSRLGRRHFPMVICIPFEDKHLQPVMEKRYGMGVVAGLNQQVFRDVEGLAREKLIGR